MKRELNADDIKNYLQYDNFNSNFSVGVSEFCPYGEGRRIDMFYFNRWNKETRGYEIKISRADFLQDKKWESYLKFCNWFYFVAPVGIIDPEELPESIGLIEIDVVEKQKSPYSNYNLEQGKEEEDGKMFDLTRKFTKRAKRLHDVGEKEYIQLLEGLLVKIIYEKNLLNTK